MSIIKTDPAKRRDRGFKSNKANGLGIEFYWFFYRIAEDKSEEIDFFLQ